MVKYAQNELFSITDFTKQIGSVVGSIKFYSVLFQSVQTKE